MRRRYKVEKCYEEGRDTWDVFRWDEVLCRWRCAEQGIATRATARATCKRLNEEAERNRVAQQGGVA